MGELPFKAFDADNHYYEATDAFTRHIDPEYAKRGDAVGDVDGKQRLLVDGRINRFIPNPTFDPVAKPGVLDDVLPGQARRPTTSAPPSVSSSRSSPSTATATRGSQMLDEQGIGGRFLFPTLGVGMEEAAAARPRARPCRLRASTGGSRTTGATTTEGRIFAAPYSRSSTRPDGRARGRSRRSSTAPRSSCMRSGPVKDPNGRRSPRRRRPRRVLGPARTRPVSSSRSTPASPATASSPRPGVAAASSRRSATTRSG